MMLPYLSHPVSRTPGRSALVPIPLGALILLSTSCAIDEDSSACGLVLEGADPSSCSALSQIATTPTLTVSPASNLRDRSVVAVRGQGFDVSLRSSARLCRAGTTSPSDCLPAGRPPVTSDTGAFAQEVVVYAGFGTMVGDWIDCSAPRSCELIVFSGRATARAAISFAPGEARPRPSLRLVASETLSDREAVRVRGSGFDGGANISLQQYLVHTDGGGWREALSTAFVTADTRGEFERTISVVAGPTSDGHDCIEARCLVAAAELQGRYAAAEAPLRFAPR